ncbi:MAG: hypothetical protein UDG94_07420 [Peptococcaceae bacterium]|nr:hypothetical protein [Peptococcaceae bacterium]
MIDPTIQRLKTTMACDAYFFNSYSSKVSQWLHPSYMAVCFIVNKLGLYQQQISFNRITVLTRNG